MIRTTLISAWSHRRRLASTTFAIVLGIAFLTGTLVIRDSAKAGFATAFTRANAGVDALVRNADDLAGSDAPRAPIDASIATRVAAVDGVAVTAPMVSGIAQIVGSDGRPLGGNGPPTLGANWITVPALTGYHLVAGRAPSRPGEVVIDARSAHDGDLGVGSRTTVLTPGPVPVTVVGIARFAGADSIGSSTLVAFTLPEAQRLLLGDTSEVTGVLVGAEGGTSADELVRGIEHVLPAGTEAVTGATVTAEQEAAIQSDFLDFFTTALLVFAAIALLVAAFSIFNTFSVLGAQRSREAALLRSIGASRAQVLRAGLVEASAIAAVGTVLGIVAGIGIGAGLRSLLGADGLGMPIDALVISATSVWSSVIVGLGVTVGAATVPALRASRVPPIAALRATAIDCQGPSRIRTSLGAVLAAAGALAVITAPGGDAVLARTGAGALCLVIALVALGPAVAPVAARAVGRLVARRGVPGDLAWRNAARSPRRTSATAAALLVGVSVMSLFTVFAASIEASMQQAMDRNFTGDLMIVPGSGGAGLDPGLAGRLAATPGVGAVAALSFPDVRLDGTTTEVTATDLGRLGLVTDIDVAAGRTSRLSPESFGASTKLAEARGWHVGDRVTASFGDGATETLRLAYLYGDRTLMGDAVVAAAVLDPHVAQPDVQVIALRYADGADPATTRRAVTARTVGAGAPEVQDRDEFVAAQSGQVEVLLRIVYALLVVAIGIAGMGIANTLSLSIHDRTRELGLLRAVGLSRRQVRAMIRTESVIVATFGTAGGIGLGVFLGWSMIRALAASEGFGTFALPVGPLAVIVVLGASLGVLAAIRPARRAAREDVLAAISAD